MTSSEARRILALPAEGPLTVREARAAWHAAAFMHHPDRVGDPVKLCEARAALVVLGKSGTLIDEETVHGSVCSTCGGSGMVTVGRGFRARETPCLACASREAETIDRTLCAHGDVAAQCPACRRAWG